MKAADAGSPDHTDALLVDGFEVKARVAQTFARCYKCKLREAVNAAHLFSVHKILWNKTFHLTSELGLELCGVKLSDRACTAETALQAFEVGGNVVADRSNGT